MLEGEMLTHKLSKKHSWMLDTKATFTLLNNKLWPPELLV